MDIGDANFCGASLGWHSPTGFRNPTLHEVESDGGLSWLRSFTGLMMPCGLDHTLGGGEDDSSHFNYQHRTKSYSPLHGRIAFTPAHLNGYGSGSQNGEYILWCEGVISQAAVFGENLQLIRRIEAKAGTNKFVIKDKVVNQGFSKTPHMFMYHINLGYPPLDEGSRFVGPVQECLWTSHEPSHQQVGYRTQPAPQESFQEQVYEHKVVPDTSGRVPVALINDTYQNGQGIGLMVEYDIKQFPCLLQWQSFQKGACVFGIEPSTNHVLGKPFARKNNQLHWLEHGEERTYVTRFKVLDGISEIGNFDAHVDAITQQMTNEYVQPSGNWHCKTIET